MALSELARELLALRAPVPGALARRIVASALGRAERTLADPLEAQELLCAAERVEAATPLARARFAVVDLETTGLAPQRAGILEIGAVRVEGMAIAGVFETLVNPGVPIPRGIRALTGIDDALVARAPRAAEALRAFTGWLAEAPGAPFVAHNARFDEGFVRRGLERSALPPLAVPVLCTRQLSRRLLPEQKRHGLDALCAHFGIENRARHRALGDAEATARALLELLALAQRQEGVATLGDLLTLAARGAKRERRGLQRGGEQIPHGAVDQLVDTRVERLEADAEPVG